MVYDENGDPVKVTALWNQGEQECVDLVHNRKILATCTINHVWLTEDSRSLRKKCLKVSELYHGLKIKRRELTLPLGTVNEPLAYVLGALLGDGCSTECEIRLSSADEKIPTKIANILKTKPKKLKSNNYSWIILDPRTSKEKAKRWRFSEFYEQNLRNKRAHEKTCPIDTIKSWDRASLLNFVAGLIDTDGSIYRPKTFNKNQLNLCIGMQAREAIECVKYAIMALWQIDVHITAESRNYKNGPLHIIKIAHNSHIKRILRELDPYLVIPSKKWHPEYEHLTENNYRPDRVGVEVIPSGKRPCWDITVDSPTSLYCLQNGLVTHNTLVSSLIQYFSMTHFRRDSIGLAAILRPIYLGCAVHRSHS